MKQKLVVAALVCLCVYGAFLRLYRLGEQSLWIDEGYTANAALSVMETGTTRLPSGYLYIQGVAYDYLAAGAMRIAGWDPFDPWPLRLPAAISGILLIPAVFWVSKKIYGSPWIALAAAALMSVSEWMVAWSREARGYTGLALVALFLFYFLREYWRGGSRRSAYMSAGLCVVGLSLHTMGIIFAPFAVGVFVARWASDRFGRDSEGRRAAIFLVSALVVCLVGWLGAVTSGFHAHMFSLAALSQTSRIGVLSVFALAAVIYLWIAGRRAESAFWAVALVEFYSIVFMGPFGSNLRYLVPLFPIILMLAVSGIFSIGGEAFETRSARIIAGTIVLAILIPSLRFAPQVLVFLGADSPQPDFKAVYAQIEREAKPNDLVISAYPQFNRVYLGQKGLWLAMSLSGPQDPLAAQAYNGVDMYAGAPIVNGPIQLQKVMSGHHGFIVLDGLAASRLPQEFSLLQSARIVTTALHLREPFGYHVFLFRF